MSNINLRSKKTICYVLSAIFFCAFGALSAVSLPAPDNAALLYYQAMLLRPEFDDDTFISFNSVLDGNDPDEKVREYLNLPDSREAIRLAESASKILDCSWGIIRSEGGYSLDAVSGELRQLVFLLEVDARSLVADGDYRAALDRCLSIRRLAQHIADEGLIGYLVSMSYQWRAFHCIEYVLSSMSPDTDTLLWLQAQLGTIQGAPPSPGRAMEITLDDNLELYRTNPELLESWRENVLERIENDSARQEFLDLTDEEFLGRARESSTSFLASLNRVIGSDIPYQQKNVEFQELKEQRVNQEGSKSADIPPYYMLDDVDDVIVYHDIFVTRLANFNAIRAAIEIYLVKAETGQLPETLPADLPKDPFTGQDFGYNVTDEGFTISFDPENLSDLRVRQFDFIVAQ
ncbi:MAG: hypothetical protein ACYS6K_06055 [Planctomycetota bacterium]|jgi:hypothetical protein